MVESISATGTFESATNKSVTSTATNLTVKKVLVAVGDTVQKGDSLVKFDQSDLEDAYADAKDNLFDTTTSANAEVTNQQVRPILICRYRKDSAYLLSESPVPANRH